VQVGVANVDDAAFARVVHRLLGSSALEHPASRRTNDRASTTIERMGFAGRASRDMDPPDLG
jgi:hypothetical protein